MKSLVSLMALNYFKLYMILTKLGTFYLVSLWHVLMFAARGLSYSLEISYLVDNEMFISLINCLYIIKRKFKCFC